MCKVINIIDVIQRILDQDYDLATKHGDQAAMLRIQGEREHYIRAMEHANMKVDTIVH